MLDIFISVLKELRDAVYLDDDVGVAGVERWLNVDDAMTP